MGCSSLTEKMPIALNILLCEPPDIQEKQVLLSHNVAICHDGTMQVSYRKLDKECEEYPVPGWSMYGYELYFSHLPPREKREPFNILLKQNNKIPLVQSLRKWDLLLSDGFNQKHLGGQSAVDSDRKTGDGQFITAGVYLFVSGQTGNPIVLRSI